MIHKNNFRCSVILSLLSCFCLCVEAQTQRALSNPNASAEAKALYCYIQSLSGKKILAGQMWSGWGFDELKYISDNTGGKQPAIMGLDLIQESVNNTQMTLATNWWKKGGIPTVMWHWGAPTKGEGYDASKLQINVANCFVAGTPEYLAFWAELTKKADHLQTLRDAKVPVLWRPYHELNGGWFWWSMGGAGGANKAENFKKLWTTMYDYFVNTRKLDNLVWVLCYSGTPDATWFPGNQYVDIAGGDEYASTNDPQQALYNNVKKAVAPNLMPTTLHQCGIPPDPDQMLSKNCMFSWFMEWHTSYIQGLDKTYLKTLYNHSLVVTLDEVGSVMTACGNTGEIVPTVNLTAPANNSSGCVGTSIAITATANISSGTVSKIDFYDGNTLLGTDTSSPYTYTFNNAPAGVHTLWVIATSAINVASIAATATVTVNALTPLDPYMQTDGGAWGAQASAQVCEGTSLNIGPHPVDANGWTWTGPNNFTASVREIQFPKITTAQGGTYTASYKDANGCTSTAKVPVVVNGNPIVTITSPINNTTITGTPANIVIAANVTTDISNVLFYNGTTLLGSDATAPYSFTWNNVANGTYTLNVNTSNTHNCSGTATATISVTQVTGLLDGLEASGISCFPNPFLGAFTIKAPESFDYIIYDALGTELGRGHAYKHVTTGEYLHAGVFMVQIVGATERHWLKVTKQK